MNISCCLKTPKQITCFPCLAACLGLDSVFLVLLRNRLLQSCISPQDPKLITSEAERGKNMHSSSVLKSMLEVLQAAN